MPALLILTDWLDRAVRRRTIRSVAGGHLTPGAAEKVVAEEAQAVLEAEWSHPER